MGAGILAMPAAVANFGLLPGSIVKLGSAKYVEPRREVVMGEMVRVFSGEMDGRMGMILEVTKKLDPCILFWRWRVFGVD